MTANPRWLEWTRRMQAIAQTGLTYAKDPYDIERYEQLRDLAVDIAATHTGDAPAHIAGLFAAETGYATPKVDVRAAVFRLNGGEDCACAEILLVRESADGLWTLPGGWADVGDAPARAAEREVFEESGYTARAVRLLAVYDRDRHGHPPIPFHVYKLIFLCELSGGAPATGHEIVDVGFFGRNALPPLSLTRIMPAQIDRLFELYHMAHAPADFD